MKIIVNISLILVVLLSTAAFAAKPKKSAKPVAEPNKPVVEPNKPAAEPNVAEPNIPVIEPNSSAKEDANQSAVPVVTVNGTVITEGQIEAVLNPRMEQMAGKVPPNMVPQYRQQIRKRVIEQLMVEELLTQKEKQSNIDVNQSELDQQINEQAAQQNLTLDEFKALLKAYGTSFSDYQQGVRKRLMFEKLMDMEFAAQNLQKPTDEQAKAYYDENIQQFSEPEKIHTKHILIKPGDSNDPNQAGRQARAKAQELLKKIKAGESFEELAKQHSACPSGKDGGDLGMQPKGAFVPEFDKAAFALKPGQVSDIVRTSFGYHIIKLVEHTDANTISFSQAKEQILKALADKQKKQLVMDYVQKIKAQADVKYADEADKLDSPLSGTKPPLVRRPAESVKPSDENSPTPKDTEKSKKD